MAIHEDLEGIEVAVCMNGQEMGEYEDEGYQSSHESATVRMHEDRWAVSKYVESVINNTFSVKCTVNPAYRASSPRILFQVFVDGVKAHGRLVQRKKINSKAHV